MELGRVLTAMATPFTPDGEVDYARARRLALALLDSGSDGLVVTGTTGEAPTLTQPEKYRLWGEVKDAVGDRAPVIAGSSDNCTADSVEYSREAQRAGADALLLTAPYYNKPTQEGMYRHFAAIAEAVDLPCICYNIPGRTGVNMTAELQLRLARIGNIAGVKESSGDFTQIARVIEGAGPEFRVWSGNDEDTFAVVSLGGWGVISVASHLVGRQIAGMIADIVAGRVTEAARTHRRLLPLIEALFVQTNPIPLKHALNVAGFGVGGWRLPLCEPDPDAARRIEAELRRHAVDLPVGGEALPAASSRRPGSGEVHSPQSTVPSSQ
ncbi:MAG TPA: 4-hydroxy-tetrahydrodipicolinate synthase [Dehalococcoidia bacterium]|nr:4-hydroxy-tetrahydrodipicolinate synthase [Dehalococcoidia bacterium]